MKILVINIPEDPDLKAVFKERKYIRLSDGVFAVFAKNDEHRSVLNRYQTLHPEVTAVSAGFCEWYYEIYAAGRSTTLGLTSLDEDEGFMTACIESGSLEYGQL